MLEAEQSRLKQNWTFLKTRLVDLQPILDRLLEYDVISIEQHGHLRLIHNSQEKFNQFMAYLIGSPEENAFIYFLEALKHEKYESVLRKIENTVPKGDSFLPLSPRRHSVTNHPKALVRGGKTESHQYNEVLARLENLELRRKQDKKEYDDKLFQFKSSTSAEILDLKEQVAHLQKSEKEYHVLKRKFNSISKEQDNQMERERDLKKIIESLSSQNARKNMENQKLLQEVHGATAMLREAHRVVDEHRDCESKIKRLKEEKKEMEEKLKAKETELDNLKAKLNIQADSFRSMENVLQQNIKHLEVSGSKS